jgi:hypothetical protein
VKPTPADIAAAIKLTESGGWIDPSEDTVHWGCVLYTSEGKRVMDGQGDTPQQAMALAWVSAHAPDGLRKSSSGGWDLQKLR